MEPAGVRRPAVRRRRVGCRPVTVVAAVVLIVASCTSNDKSATTTVPTSRSSPAAPEARAGWPTAGRDLANSRAAVEFPLTAVTVQNLKTAWRTELHGAGSLTTTPIVRDGTVYTGTGSGQVFAVDLDTGRQLWVSDATGPNIGPYGVAVDDTRVYTLNGSKGVVALDRRTGKRIWATQVAATPTTGVDIQPIVVDGLVIVSTVPVSLQGIYTPGDRGVVYALDAATGTVRWSFDTVQGDLWGHPEVNSGGGAWYPPAVDLTRQVVYVGVANPAPFPGTKAFPNGTSRPGPNLYTNSLVALDLHTGALRWYHQVVPHDIFDRDQVHALIVGNTVVSAGKSGIIVGLNPDDGTVRWQRRVGMHHNDNLEELPGPTEVAPGTYGGILTPPSAADGVVYAAVVNAPTELRPDEVSYFGAELGWHPGEVIAVDATTGKLKWSTKVPGDPLGGTTVVGDLVLTVLTDGKIIAIDRADGTIPGTVDAGGGVNGWMAVAGDRIIVPVGQANPPALLALRIRT